MVSSLFMIAWTAAQAPLSLPATAQPQTIGAPGPGRLFISPMGEPFFGRVPGEDGLIIWFNQADRNHDGTITLDEMTADADRFFQVLDRNHDGEIDPDDIDYYEQVVPQIRAQTMITTSTTPGGDIEEHADSETSAGRLGLLQIPEPVASADSNFNRGVSPQEFRDAAVKRFQLLDGNHTGKLTLPDLQSVRHAASTYAKRRPIKPGESDDPSSAEYGNEPPPP
jgi:Ca2+-binding EF-hand superfamily protein